MALTVDFTEHRIDGAHDGDDVGHLVAGDDVGQHREVREGCAAPLHPIRLCAPPRRPGGRPPPAAPPPPPRAPPPGREEIGPSGSPSRAWRTILIDSRNSCIRTR